MQEVCAHKGIRAGTFGVCKGASGALELKL